MSRLTENSHFICQNCGKVVLPLSNGSYRNHCPFCLHSLHVDLKIGDRSNPCRGLMKPVDVIYHTKKGYQIIHVCQTCGHKQPNKVANDTILPDHFDLILHLMSSK